VCPQKFIKSGLRWWWWWLLLVNLLVRLQMVECLEHILHKLILSSYELLHLMVVVGIIGLVVASLTIALIVPPVHHLRDFYERGISFLESYRTPNYIL
jgi:uncharacterized membrane protein YhaH (DUF805 family)